MADSYRALIRLVGAQVLVSMGSRIVSVSARRSGDAILSAVFLLTAVAILGLAVAVAVKGYRLADALQLAAPAAWGVGFFVPCVSLLVLLSISSRASRLCRDYGIRVGLLGPVGDSVDAFVARHTPR